MSEYKYFNKFLELASIDPKDIIIQEIDVFNNNVCIYIVTRNRSMFDVYTAVGSIDKPISDEHINHVLLPESLIKELFQKIK